MLLHKGIYQFLRVKTAPHPRSPASLIWNIVLATFTTKPTHRIPPHPALPSHIALLSSILSFHKKVCSDDLETEASKRGRLFTSLHLYRHNCETPKRLSNLLVLQSEERFGLVNISGRKQWAEDKKPWSPMGFCCLASKESASFSTSKDRKQCKQTVSDLNLRIRTFP
jgi:hypothetical protein